jgi:pilus assembly protein FimV
VEHYTERQYDDDLTIVADEYDDSLQTDVVDLFEFPTYDESPLARLKSLVLSIDWEITDDILHQFSEELVDLKDIWADEKIYLVYIQVLEKISNYIYKEKADANPNAIKLLLSFYYNLEKMVSTESMTEGEKRLLLLEDVRKFEILKKQISKGRKTVAATAHGEIHADEMQPPPGTVPDTRPILSDLKAIVLGIDWEITESDLERLRDEVQRLKEVFAGSQPKQIFLQGLDALAAYIRVHKGGAHADAFKLLHSFVAGLEKIVTVPMSFDEEKKILLPQVEKFHEFKAIIKSKVTPNENLEEKCSDDDVDGGTIAPALSAVPEEEERGLQKEQEAAALGLTSSSMVERRGDRFFTDIDELKPDQPELQADGNVPDQGRAAVESHLDAMFQTETTPAGFGTDRETALQGVGVEIDEDDESDHDRLRYQTDDLAPALTGLDDTVMMEKSEAVAEESIEFEADVERRLDNFFGTLDVDGEKPPGAVLEEEPEEAIATGLQESVPFSSFSTVADAAEVIALPGKDVGSEEEDESGREPPAFAGEDLAPALSGESEAELMATGEDRVAAFEYADQGSVEEERAFGEMDAVADIEDHLDFLFGNAEEPSQEDQTLVDNRQPALAEKSAGESISDWKREEYEDDAGRDQLSSSRLFSGVPEEGKLTEEFAFEPVEEEEEGAPAEAFPDSEYAAVFEGVEEPVAVALDSEDTFAVEDLVVEAPETQTDQKITNMDDDSYAALADELAGERLALTGANGVDEVLATQIRELIRSEVEVIRQEILSGFERLRKDLLDREG